MRKLLKENLKTLLTIVITAIVATTTTIFAYSLLADDVGYTPKDNIWKVDNVDAAIDDLRAFTTSSGHNIGIYSTDEIVIGTWIDGKPLYRKVITGISYTPAAYSWADSPVYIDNVDRVVNVGLSQGASFVYTFLGSHNNGRIRVWNCMAHSYTYNTMLVEYTKTTD